MNNFKNFLSVCLFCLWFTSGYSQKVSSNVLYVKVESDPNLSFKLQTSAFQDLSKLTGSVPKRIFNEDQIATVSKRIVQKSRGDRTDFAKELSKWYKLILPFDQDAQQIASKWKNRKGIIAIEPHYIRELSVVPNDPLYASLSYNHFEKQNFPQAWDIQKANSSIIIAIIDSGVDYNHPDLINKLWINSEEIPNNGIDDDGNGYIDDVKGWDFWQDGESDNPSQDNDPIGEFQNHGTHVAGIAAAETNNQIGLAGTGYHAKFMAIKAGGTSKYRNAISFGYEGMLYASLNGADVINCSWGGSGFSAFENDIVQTVLANGSVIIAAAGNDAESTLNYPAAYDGVLSVGSFESNNKITSFSNYGYDLDVFASGSNINSTVFNGVYGNKSGTSMATPIVAGLAALVKAEHPDWSPSHIRNQIRVTSTDMYAANSIELAGKLGQGYINAQKALEEDLPGYELISFQLLNNFDEKLRPNEVGKARIKIKSIGKNTASAKLDLSSLTSGVLVLETNKVISELDKNEETIIEFPIELTESFDFFKIPLFKLTPSDLMNNYEDQLFIPYDELIYQEHKNSDILLSLSSDGTIGFVDPNNSIGGVGFIPKDNDGTFDEANNILYSSSLIMRYQNQIADRAISSEFSETDFKASDFYSTNEIGNLVKGSGQATVDRLNFPEVKFKTTSYSSSENGINKSILIQYSISNRSQNRYDSFYVGIYADFDIGDYGKNWAKYDEASLSLIQSDFSQFVAIAPINVVSGVLPIDNTFNGTPTDVDFGIYSSSSSPVEYDGFTKAEKLKAMSAGFKKIELDKLTDVSGLIYSGPFSILPNDSISVGFVLAYATTYEEVTEQIQNAKSKSYFEVSTSIENSKEFKEFEITKESFEIVYAFPNPFNPSTTIQIKSGIAQLINVVVYDVLGRKVQSKELSIGKGIQNIPINLNSQSTGIYLVSIQSKNIQKQISVMLMK